MTRLFLLMLALAGLREAAVAADPAQDIYAKHADSVVTITTYDECLFPAQQGSGIIINKSDKWHGSFILTNYHVIRRAGLIIVVSKSGYTAPAQIRYFDESSDTALLHTSQPIVGTPPMPASAVDVGSQVFAIGTPRGLGWTISSGIVSSIRNHNGRELVQFTAPISSGSSGGPLFNAQGELLGITSFKLRDSENLNFAIRTSPETMSELEKHLWLGQFPKPDEPEWCIGHFEQNQRWMDNDEKAKSWNAHSTLIADLEKRFRSLENSMSADEKKAAEQERLIFDLVPTTGKWENMGRASFLDRAHPSSQRGWQFRTARRRRTAAQTGHRIAAGSGEAVSSAAPRLSSGARLRRIFARRLRSIAPTLIGHGTGRDGSPSRPSLLTLSRGRLGETSLPDGVIASPPVGCASNASVVPSLDALCRRTRSEDYHA